MRSILSGVSRPSLAWLAFLLPIVACTGVVDSSTTGGTGAPPSGAAGTSGTSGTPAVPSSPDFVPLANVAARLTPEHYANTVSDVLGVQLTDDDRALFPMDQPLEGFINIGSGQSVAAQHVLAYSRLASRVVQRMDWPGLLSANASCQEPIADCIGAAVSTFGARLFRRPLNNTEVADFSRVFSEVLAAGADFQRATSATFEAMLQAPQFLYLLEVEVTGTVGLREVAGYELASRLSYALWQSAPDGELLTAAADESLSTPHGLAGQITRLLAHPNARRATQRYLLDWARLANLPDPDGLRADLIASAQAFYQDHIWTQRGGLLDSFASRRAFLSPALAEKYGLAAQGDGILPYDTSALPNRGGLLSQPGVVAGMTNADGGEIVTRGLFLTSQLFCGEVPSPPATLAEAIEAFVAELPPNASERLIAETRLTRATCASCHSLFDPLAYAFENFDFRGTYRTVDEHGNPLASDGWIPAFQLGAAEDQPYANLNDYMAQLAAVPKVQQCLARKHVDFLSGRRSHAEHQGSIDQISAAFVAGGGSYAAMVQAVVSHDLFRIAPAE